MGKLTLPKEELMRPGHMGCQGCGGTLAMRIALKAAGPDTILSVPACCWAVMPGVWPNTCINIPMLYTAFEVTGASISGIRAALDAKGKKDTNVIGWAGDGGTFDIGIQSLSGMVERNTRALYVCYDNEAYMNTGIQRSSSTPEGSWTTTTPVGTTKYWEKGRKKNMIGIMVAHGIPYAATANVAYPEDLFRKVQKALSIDGPSYIQILSPCPTGWKSPPAKTVKIAKEAITSLAYPLYEVENGRYKINVKPREPTPLKDYMYQQGRFKHLPEEFILEKEKEFRASWEHLLRLEEFTNED